MGEAVRHPAKFTDSIVAAIAEIAQRYGIQWLLDQFAGTCKIARIRDHGFTGHIFANEMEKEWGVQGLGEVVLSIGDAEHLPYPDDTFDGSATSVAYANRLADHHNAKDGSKRNTYKHSLGRDLTDGNTGMMQWGRYYCTKHKACYIELRRVLRNGGIFILNISDHIRKGKQIRVTLWHRLCLASLGFELVEAKKISTPRLRYGANGDKRVGHESILVFRLHKA